MRKLLVIAAVLALLAAPANALAQGGSPFQPLPPPAPEAPPQMIPEDASAAEEDDGDFSALEWLALAGVGIALFGGVAWAIMREDGGGLRGRRGRKRRREAAAGRARTAGGSRGGTTSKTGGGKGKDDAKAPPPPPRKQRQAAQAKRRAKGKARPKAKRR